MAFSVKARVLLELGSELISSDAIAIYELVKNAIDAGSQKTVIDVFVVLQYSEYRRLREILEEGSRITKATIVERIKEVLEPSAPEISKEAFLTRIRDANDNQVLSALENAFSEENYIEILDNGHGMSLSELRELYLTIGTPSRLMEKHSLFKKLPLSTPAGIRVPLGEKGIGRLAAMRLGEQLDVVTSRKNEPNWNRLEVDWGLLKDEPNLDLDKFPADPTSWNQKDEALASGTRVKIHALRGDWTEASLQELAHTDFSKLYDPFLKDNERDDIRIRFNNRPVLIPVFDHTKLNVADAVCSASFTIENGKPVLAGEVRYLSKKGQTKTFRHTA